MQRLSPRFRSQHFFLCKIPKETGAAIRKGTNMAAENQQKHLSLSFATKAFSRNSETFKLVYLNGNNAAEGEKNSY